MKKGKKKMEKFYNFETLFISVRDALRGFLKENKIYYELSKAYQFYHFEIKATKTQADMINDFLDSISICEKSTQND